MRPNYRIIPPSLCGQLLSKTPKYAQTHTHNKYTRHTPISPGFKLWCDTVLSLPMRLHQGLGQDSPPEATDILSGQKEGDTNMHPYTHTYTTSSIENIQYTPASMDLPLKRHLHHIRGPACTSSTWCVVRISVKSAVCGPKDRPRQWKQHSSACLLQIQLLFPTFEFGSRSTVLKQ